MRLLAPVAWLTTLWVLLWTELSLANVASGVVVALGVVVAQPGSRRLPERHRVRFVPLLVLAGYFVWKLVESNITIAREVVTPRDHIAAGVIEVPLRPCSDLAVAIVANVLSLTPGTLTLEVRNLATPTLYVHVLRLHDLDAARADVEKMANMVDAAFPSRRTE